MAYQPVLTETLCKTDDIKLFSFYKNKYTETDDPEHIHNCYEIYVNLSGNVSFLHKRNIFKIQTGDIMILAPGDVHYCIFHSSCIHEHYCLWFDLSDNSDIAHYIRTKELTGHIRLRGELKERLFAIMHSLNSETEKFEKTMYFFELLKLLGEKDGTEPESDAPLPKTMQEILAYVDENFVNIRFIEEIADKFHISIPTLNRWFREYVHLPPSKLITAKKLAYAEKLLRGDSSVADVCYMAGFPDCSRFISLFRSKYGLTPLQYKKQISGNKS